MEVVGWLPWGSVANSLASSMELHGGFRGYFRGNLHEKLLIFRFPWNSLKSVENQYVRRFGTFFALPCFLTDDYHRTISVEWWTPHGREASMFCVAVTTTCLRFDSDR